MQVYYFQGSHGSFVEEEIQGLFKDISDWSRTPFSTQKSFESKSFFLVLQQHEQFHPEGFFEFAGLDKVSTEIQGLSSPDCNFQGPSR